jgi:hypothetical protein
LRFARTSPPSGCAGDSHPQVVEHARHTLISGVPPAREIRHAKHIPLRGEELHVVARGANAHCHHRPARVRLIVR